MASWEGRCRRRCPAPGSGSRRGRPVCLRADVVHVLPVAPARQIWRSSRGTRLGPASGSRPSPAGRDSRAENSCRSCRSGWRCGPGRSGRRRPFRLGRRTRIARWPWEDSREPAIIAAPVSAASRLRCRNFGVMLVSFYGCLGLLVREEPRVGDTATVDRRAEQHGGGVGRRVVGQQRRGPTAAHLGEEHQLVAGHARDADAVGNARNVTRVVCISGVKRDRKMVPHAPVDWRNVPLGSCQATQSPMSPPKPGSSSWPELTAVSGVGVPPSRVPSRAGFPRRCRSGRGSRLRPTTARAHTGPSASASAAFE